jgi:hypothetical protein
MCAFCAPSNIEDSLVTTFACSTENTFSKLQVRGFSSFCCHILKGKENFPDQPGPQGGKYRQV